LASNRDHLLSRTAASFDNHVESGNQVHRATFFDLTPLRRCGRQPMATPTKESVVDHVPHPIRRVKVIRQMRITSMRCADSSTMWARRHVTTDRDNCRTISNNRLPSSLLILPKD
jgi:hypothetical protein